MPQLKSTRRGPANVDHARRTHVPAPNDAEIEHRLTTLVKPAVYAELDYYRHLGHRNRLRGLPVMVALVLALIWRRVPGVCTLQRMLARERILWTQPTGLSARPLRTLSNLPGSAVRAGALPGALSPARARPHVLARSLPTSPRSERALPPVMPWMASPWRPCSAS